MSCSNPFTSHHCLLDDSKQSHIGISPCPTPGPTSLSAIISIISSCLIVVLKIQNSSLLAPTTVMASLLVRFFRGTMRADASQDAFSTQMSAQDLSAKRSRRDQFSNAKARKSITSLFGFAAKVAPLENGFVEVSRGQTMFLTVMTGMTKHSIPLPSVKRLKTILFTIQLTPNTNREHFPLKAHKPLRASREDHLAVRRRDLFRSDLHHPGAHQPPQELDLGYKDLQILSEQKLTSSMKHSNIAPKRN